MKKVQKVRKGNEKNRNCICEVEDVNRIMKRIKENWKVILAILAGNMLVAAGVVYFVLPNQILAGGVSTVALIVHSWIPSLSTVFLINFLTIALFFVGWLCLGKHFALSCVLSSIVYPLFVSIFSQVDTADFSHVDPLLSALFAGGIMGVGLGLVFRVNASTGGMDIPALILHKYTHLSESVCVSLVDGITILCGLTVFGLNALLTGFLAIYTCSKAINWASVLGSSPAKNVLIISDSWMEIQSYLLGRVHRGVTILEAKGGYTSQERPVLMCVVSGRQYPKLEQEIEQIDPRAFIVVTDVHEVRGSGFTFRENE